MIITFWKFLAGHWNKEVTKRTCPVCNGSGHIYND